MTERNVVAFIGWLKDERVAGRRRVASTSVPQYISAIRKMHKMYLGEPPEPFPFLDVVIWAYKKWEEDKFPAQTVRCGVNADVLVDMMQKIWHHGMTAEHTATIRDCALLVFTFCFNGLRESSVLSLLATKAWLQGTNAYTSCSIWKAREVSREQLVCFHQNVGVHSPIDLVIRWKRLRPQQKRFFGLPPEPDDWKPGVVTNALRRTFEALHIQPPPDRKLTSHYLRIGAHTEQVLLEIPLEARMTRFGWGPASEEMASLCFDRLIRPSTASAWFFGAWKTRTAEPSHTPNERV